MTGAAHGGNGLKKYWRLFYLVLFSLKNSDVTMETFRICLF